LQFEKSRSSIKIQGIFVILLSFFVIRNFRGTRLFIEMLAEYMFRERLGTPVLSIRCPETSAIFIQYRFQPESKFKQMNLVPVAFDTPARHYSWSTDVGAIFDSACAKWSEQCGTRGACLSYHNKSLSVYIFLLVCLAKVRSKRGTCLLKLIAHLVLFFFMCAIFCVSVRHAVYIGLAMK